MRVLACLGVLLGLALVCQGQLYGVAANWPASCSAGQQSPVDLNVPVNMGYDSKELQVHYPAISAWKNKLVIKNTGHAIEVTYADSATSRDSMGYIVHAERRFNVNRIVFRSPSEHTVNGTSYLMEMQIIHEATRTATSNTSAYVVVSALFGLGAANRFLLEQLDWNQLPYVKGYTRPLTSPFWIGAAFDGLHQGYYQYVGTTTEPPCTEGTVWNVLEAIQTMSQEQFNIINNIFAGNRGFAGGAGNNRPIQPLGSRRVYLHNYKVRGDGDSKPILAATRHHDDNATSDDYLEVMNPHDPEAVSNMAPYDEKKMQRNPYTMNGRDWHSLCRSGRYQSPIDIRLQFGNPNGDFEFLVDYDAAQVTLTNIYGTISATGGFGGLYCQNDTYKGYELTFHAPSEHSINGVFFPLEMQILHKMVVEPQREFYAVVSVLFQEGTESNKFLESLGWSSLPSEFAQTTSPKNLVNLMALDGWEKGYYSYAGSLSRPPCTEAVRRFVMRTFQEVSPLQLTQFRRLFYNNRRSIKPRNGRGVALHNVNDAIDAVPLNIQSIAPDTALIPL